MSKWILDVVHSCVWGQAQVSTLSRCRYYVTFIDDFSRHTWIYSMRQKSEVFGHFQKFKAEAKNVIGFRVRVNISDNDGDWEMVCDDGLMMNIDGDGHIVV